MIRTFAGGRRVAALILALFLLLVSAGQVLAHSRYDRVEPSLDAPLTGEPVVLQLFFTQELTSRSSLRVLDANGVQVDLGDGGVDLNDPIRKKMHVSLPALPAGVYTIDLVTDSAEDGHAEPGTITFVVGVSPPSADQPAVEPVVEPAAAPSTDTGEAPSGHSLDAAQSVAY